MATVNSDDQVYLTCDDCGTESPVFDDDEFMKLVAAARADGWRIRQEDGEWTHACPSCNGQHDRVAKARAKFGLR